jgi:hypothetical protein
MKKRDIEWVEKLEGGIKRKVRVKFPGHGRITWQFKCSDQEQWDYDTPPSADDWSRLEEKVDALYHRRRAPYKDLELVKRMKAAAENE